MTEEKKCLLESLGKIFNISEERHKAKVRQAVNDELQRNAMTNQRVSCLNASFQTHKHYYF